MTNGLANQSARSRRMVRRVVLNPDETIVLGTRSQRVSSRHLERGPGGASWVAATSVGDGRDAQLRSIVRRGDEIAGGPARAVVRAECARAGLPGGDVGDRHPFGLPG